MTIQNAAGATYTQSTFTAAMTTNSLGSSYTVPVDIYETYPLPGAKSSHKGRRLKYKAGEIITQAQLDALYLEPTFTSVSPTGGTTAGGTAVTITGVNFTDATGVTFGGTAATAVVVVSDTRITCVTPAKTAGAKDIVVTTPAGTVTGTGAYTYA